MSVEVGVEGTHAVKKLKNRTKCSEITLHGDKISLSLKQWKVMCKLGGKIKTVCSAFSKTC